MAHGNTFYRMVYLHLSNTLTSCMNAHHLHPAVACLHMQAVLLQPASMMQEGDSCELLLRLCQGKATFTRCATPPHLTSKL